MPPIWSRYAFWVVGVIAGGLYFLTWTSPFAGLFSLMLALPFFRNTKDCSKFYQDVVLSSCCFAYLHYQPFTIWCAFVSVSRMFHTFPAVYICISSWLILIDSNGWACGFLFFAVIKPSPSPWRHTKHQHCSQLNCHNNHYALMESLVLCYKLCAIIKFAEVANMSLQY